MSAPPTVDRGGAARRQRTGRTVLVERHMAVRAERLWRALTEAPLIAQWLMKNDFQPIVGHRFTLQAAPLPYWNGVADCQVLIVEPCRRLAHTWNASGQEASRGPRTVVTWTLAPTGSATGVRLEQAGFRVEEGGRCQAAEQHWRGFVTALERVAAQLEEAKTRVP